uniref:Uncharacterized protein n=1 Tax=Strix occidentalis caurina TaxID=311401 RepID=A0A8D0FN19_STROC
MAAPMELFCWAGGWGLPSVDPDCLAVLVSGGAGADHNSPQETGSGGRGAPREGGGFVAVAPEPRAGFAGSRPLRLLCRNITLTTTSRLRKGRTRWPSCPCWKRNCCRCW